MRHCGVSMPTRKRRRSPTRNSRSSLAMAAGRACHRRLRAQPCLSRKRARTADERPARCARRPCRDGVRCRVGLSLSGSAWRPTRSQQALDLGLPRPRAVTGTIKGVGLAGWVRFVPAWLGRPRRGRRRRLETRGTGWVRGTTPGSRTCQRWRARGRHRRPRATTTRPGCRSGAATGCRSGAATGCRRRQRGGQRQRHQRTATARPSSHHRRRTAGDTASNWRGKPASMAARTRLRRLAHR